MNENTPNAAVEPEMVKIKAMDVKPYHYGLWCSVGDGKPHTNEIEAVKWSADGLKVVMMLSSHNFLIEAPDTELELVPIQPHQYYVDKYAGWKLGPRPTFNAEELDERAKKLAAERDEALSELKFIRENYAQEDASALTRDGLALKVAAMKALLREVRKALYPLRLSSEEYAALRVKVDAVLQEAPPSKESSQ